MKLKIKYINLLFTVEMILFTHLSRISERKAQEVREKCLDFLIDEIVKVRLKYQKERGQYKKEYNRWVYQLVDRKNIPL